MGQKIHPTGFRLALNKNWASRWYANNKNFSTNGKFSLHAISFLQLIV